MSSPPTSFPKTTAPMGRRERKKLETRRRILDAALGLMADHGYDNVKIEAIAAKADIANATFFLHFPTKAALITAFNELVSDKIADRLSEFDLSAIDQLELLRAIVMDEWGRYSESLRRIVADAAHDSALFASSSDSLTAIVEDIIRKGQTEGSLATDFDADLIAQTLMAGWRAAALTWARNGDVEQARRANRQVLDLVIRGTASRKDS